MLSRETQNALLDPERQKARVSEMLRAILTQKSARYWLQGQYVRWGRVHEDLFAIIEGREFDEVCYDDE